MPLFNFDLILLYFEINKLFVQQFITFDIFQDIYGRLGYLTLVDFNLLNFMLRRNTKPHE